MLDGWENARVLNVEASDSLELEEGFLGLDAWVGGSM